MATPGITVVGSSTYAEHFGTAGDDAFAGGMGEEIFWTGLGDDVVHGSGGPDTIYADVGNDWFDGGSNAVGGDTLVFDRVNASTWETADLNYRPVRFDLKKTVQHLEYFGTKTVYGIENVTGGYGRDKLFGDGGANFLSGLGGGDLIDGRKGHDSLYGGDGSDTLIGGRGADELNGASSYPFDDGARDFFRYASTRDSTDAEQDTISGYFNGGAKGGDKIDLSRIDADGSLKSGNGTFKFIGSADIHTTRRGEVQVKDLGGNFYLVNVDTDKDADAEMAILVRSANPLSAGDFIL